MIDDTVMQRLQEEAARRNRTVSELAEAAVRLMLDHTAARHDLPQLPVWDSGGALVDIAVRDELIGAMEFQSG